MSMTPEDLIKKTDSLYAAGKFHELESFLLETLSRTRPADVSVRILLYNELGTYYRGCGRLDEAVENFTSAISLLRTSRGSDSLDYATAVNNLAGALRMKGEYDRARTLFREANRIYARFKEQNPMLYASGINNLALLDMAAKDYASAIPALQEALSLMSADHRYLWEKATTICNLGICSLRCGRYPEAEKNLLKARDLFLATPESRRGHLAFVYSALGDLCRITNQPRLALEYFTKAGEYTLKYYGQTPDYLKLAGIIKELQETCSPET